MNPGNISVGEVVINVRHSTKAGAVPNDVVVGRASGGVGTTAGRVENRIVHPDNRVVVKEQLRGCEYLDDSRKRLAGIMENISINVERPSRTAIGHDALGRPSAEIAILEGDVSAAEVLHHVRMEGG